MGESRRLGFKAHFLPHVLNEELVLLLSEAAGKYLLRGNLYAQIAPLLDGTRTMDEIVEALGPEVRSEKAYYALMTLEKKGYIAPAPDGLPLAQAAFWHGLDADAKEAAERLAETSVAVISLGDANRDADALSGALKGLEIFAAPEEKAGLVVAVVEDYLQRGLAEMNKRMREAGRPWMMAKAMGQVLWLGPVFNSGEGACWACLARRLRENRTEEMNVQGSGAEHPVLSRGALPTTRALAVNLAATEIAKWAALGGHKVLKDSVLTFDLKALETREHKVQRLPDCEVCGEPEKEDSVSTERARVVLGSRPKRFTADGGHRAHRPEETFARLEPLISPITGIVPDLVRVETLDEVNVYLVKQSSPLVARERNEARLGRRDAAAGKGATDIQAKVSCLAEAVERYSCYFRGNEPREKARLADLGEDAIHPYALLNFSERQYAAREDWNKDNQGFNWVPMPFEENKEIEWTPNWSLTNAKIRWLPTEFCYFAYARDEEHEFCRADSNGCASGNNLEEAVLQGFLELVERDSMALWWYNRVRRPAIELESFNDPFFDGMSAYYRRRGRTLAVVDITSDLGIPAAAALSWEGDGGRILTGLGAHLDARIAVSRALSELNQMIPLGEAFNEARDERAPDLNDDRHISEWMEEATLENQPYLVPDERRSRAASDFPEFHGDDLLDDIHTCLEIIGKRGMEMIVLDLTRPDLDFSTVRVTVPGLRHFWARFAPGRLYDVPVELGWMDRKKDESELNPIPFFL